MENVKKVLVVCRMPEECQKTVTHGFSIAERYNAELYVLNIVYDPFMFGDWNLPIPLGIIGDEYKRILQQSKKRLDTIVISEKKGRSSVKVNEIVREGRPTGEIIKVVREEHIDLLIMLAHEESRLEHILFGRSNDDLIRKMPCSILLIKQEPQPLPEIED